jgi:Lrp/AsnC family transcriptional regulator for asnA, asnC and gidA
MAQPRERRAVDPSELDALDHGIMDELRRDGRATNSAIASKLGVTEGTIRQRTRKLFESGAFRVLGRANPEIMPDQQVCLVGLKLGDSRKLEARAREVAALPEVMSVAIVTGRYDLVAEVVVPSNKGLIGFLTDSLASVRDLESTETFLLLKTFDKWI